MQRVEDLVAKIRRAMRIDNEILLAYLFGSMSEGTSTEQSDIDVGVLHCSESSTKASDLQEKLSKELKLNKNKIDVVDISTAPLLLKTNIINGLKLHDKGDNEKRLIEELISRFAVTRLAKDSSVVVDSSVIDSLYSKLHKVKEETAYLKEEILTKEADAVITDGTLCRAMARSVQELIEAIFNTCRYLVSVKNLGVAKKHVDLPRLLRQHSIMPLSLAETLEETATLRNTLVQGCAEVDHHKLFDEADEIVEHIAPEFEEWVLGLLR